MSFATLALICLVALLGPVLAATRGLPVLVLVGELAVGFALGVTGFGVLSPHDPTFTLLAQIGFGLVMFVAGSHVPIRDPALRRGFGIGALRAALVGAVAVPIGLGIAAAFGSAHGLLFSVLIASSSAAFVLPAIGTGMRVAAARASAEPGAGASAPPSDGPRNTGDHSVTSSLAQLLPQIAIADAVCIVLVPLAIDPPRAGSAALGALLVIAAAGVVWLFLNWAERSGRRRAVHLISEERELAIELRASLTILFALAALAAWAQVSVMLAGFSFGLAVAAIGPPRRLAKQLFALTEGFFGPIFYVWLGASVNMRELVAHPTAIVLGLALGAGAILAHSVGVLARQRLSAAVLTSAQLGVPVAAATTGLSLGVLAPGEDAAMLLGALVTVVASTFAARRWAVGAQARATPLARE